MTNFRVVGIPTRVAEKVRATLRSPGYGHPAHTEVASGYGPCRHCLQYFAEGEDRRILFTYDPFHGLESLPQPGPVFVHADPCERYDERAGFPSHLLAHPLSVIAYGRGRILRAERHLTGRDVEPAVAELLEKPDVDYIHVRDTEAGCYDFRVERGGTA